MESRNSHSPGSRAESWIALALCAAVLLGTAIEHLVHNRPAHARSFAPDWLPLAAVGFAAAGLMQLQGPRRWLRVQRALRWCGLLLMVWVANGLPFDLLTLAGLIGDPATGRRANVDWPELATRTLALAAAIVLARLALAHPADSASVRAATWYGYAAFVFALPYPVLRMHWALGGTLGLSWPGAAGKGFAPLLIAIPFVLAAVLSLLLVSPRHWKPRWLLLTAGWTATAIMAMIGPAACWVMLTTLVSGRHAGLNGMAVWVPCLFYGTWFLLAIAEGAATRSYQLRSAALRMSSPTGSSALQEVGRMAHS
jgi:hypothetical protein